MYAAPTRIRHVLGRGGIHAAPTGIRHNPQMMAAAYAAATICRPLSGAPFFFAPLPGADAPGDDSVAPSALRRRNVQRPTFERLHGLMPQGMSLSRSPASPSGLRRDRPALDRVPLKQPGSFLRVQTSPFFFSRPQVFLSESFDSVPAIKKPETEKRRIGFG